jgi:hypothetical protein
MQGQFIRQISTFYQLSKFLTSSCLLPRMDQNLRGTLQAREIALFFSLRSSRFYDILKYGMNIKNIHPKGDADIARQNLWICAGIQYGPK